MAVVSFIAGGMLALVASLSSLAFADASTFTALKIYMLFGFGLPLVAVGLHALRTGMVAANSEQRGKLPTKG